MPQPKHDRCLLCRWSEFGDLSQKDETTGEPIGKCCHDAPEVVVVHFREPDTISARVLAKVGREHIDEAAIPGAIHEIVTGSQPVVKASFWCRHWEPVPTRPHLP